MTLSRSKALTIWQAAGFTTREAREWMRHWGNDGPTCETVEDEAWMAAHARLWSDCGFTGQDTAAWADSDITTGLGLAIIGRVHGLVPDDDQGHCPGVLTLTGDDDDDLLAAFTLYGHQDRRSPLVRWASGGLADDRILGYWHAGIPLVEALTGGHDDDALDLLTALHTPCPMTHRGTAAA